MRMASRPTVVEVEDEGEGVKWLKHYCSLHEILLVGEGDFSFSLSLANAFGSASNIVSTSLDPHDAVVIKYAKAELNLESLKKMGAMVLHGIDATKMKLHSYLTARKFDRIIFNFPHAGFKGKENSMQMINLHRQLVYGFFNSARHMLRADGEIHVNHKIGDPYCKWNLEELARSTSLVLLECANFDIKEYPGYTNKRGDGARCDQPFPLGNCCTFKFKDCTTKLKQKKKAGKSGSSFVNIVEIEDVRENSGGNHHRQTILHPQTLGFYMDARHQPNFLMGVEPVHLSQLNQPTEISIQNTCLSLYREHPVGVNSLFQGFDLNRRHAIQAYQRGVYVNEVDEEQYRRLHAYLRGGSHVNEAAEERHRSLHTYLRCDGHVNGADEGRRISLNAYLSGGDHINVADEQIHRNLHAYLRGGDRANEAGEELRIIFYAYLGGGGHVNEVDECCRSLHAYLRCVSHVSVADEEPRRCLHAYLGGVGYASEAGEELRIILHAYLSGGGHANEAGEELHIILHAYLGGGGHVNEVDDCRRSLDVYLRGVDYLRCVGHVSVVDEERYRNLYDYLGGVGHASEADGVRRRSLHAYLGGEFSHASEADEVRRRSLHAYLGGGVGHVSEADEVRGRSLHAYLGGSGHVSAADEGQHISLNVFQGG